MNIEWIHEHCTVIFCFVELLIADSGMVELVVSNKVFYKPIYFNCWMKLTTVSWPHPQLMQCCFCSLHGGCAVIAFACSHDTRGTPGYFAEYFMRFSLKYHTYMSRTFPLQISGSNILTNILFETRHISSESRYTDTEVLPLAQLDHRSTVLLQKRRTNRDDSHILHFGTDTRLSSKLVSSKLLQWYL